MFYVIFAIIFVLSVSTVVFNIIGNILCLKSYKSSPKSGLSFNGGNDFHETAHRMATDAHRQAHAQAIHDHNTAHFNAIRNFDSAMMDHNAIHEANHMNAMDFGMSMNMGGFGGMGMM